MKYNGSPPKPPKKSKFFQWKVHIKFPNIPIHNEISNKKIIFVFLWFGDLSQVEGEGTVGLLGVLQAVLQYRLRRPAKHGRIVPNQFRFLSPTHQRFFQRVLRFTFWVFSFKFSDLYFLILYHYLICLKVIFWIVWIIWTILMLR